MDDVHGFRAGSPVLFRRLVREHSGRLRAIIRAYASDDEEGRDLLQQSWLEIYRCRSQFTADGSLIGWMMSVCRRQCLQHARRRAGRPVSHPELGEAAAPAETPPDPDLAPAISDAVAGLAPRERDAVVLRLVEGLSTREAAAHMGCAEGTVKALLHRGTRKLRESLRHFR